MKANIRGRPLQQRCSGDLRVCSNGSPTFLKNKKRERHLYLWPYSLPQSLQKLLEWFALVLNTQQCSRNDGIYTATVWAHEQVGSHLGEGHIDNTSASDTVVYFVEISSWLLEKGRRKTPALGKKSVRASRCAGWVILLAVYVSLKIHYNFRVAFEPPRKMTRSPHRVLYHKNHAFAYYWATIWGETIPVKR